MESNRAYCAWLALPIGALAACVPAEKEKQVEGDVDMLVGVVEGNGAARANTPAASCEGQEPLSGQLEDDLTVGPGCVRFEDVRVEDGVSLTVAPGTRVEFLPGGFLNVGGSDTDSATLTAVGTLDAPIIFTSSNPNPRPGDWQCIRLRADGSELDNVVLEYGGAPCAPTADDDEGMLQIEGSPRGITNTTVRDSSTIGVLFGGTPSRFENNTFARNGEAPLRIAPEGVTSIGTGNTFDPGDVILVRAGSAERSGTWENLGVPYRVSGTVQLYGDIVVAPGVRIEMIDGSFQVASFDVLGTAEEPVVFTSAQSEPRPGDWGCIYSAATVRVEHAVIEYAGNGEGCGATTRAAIKADTGSEIVDTVFRNISGVAVDGTDCDGITAWCSNQFEAVEQGPVSCTLDGILPCP